MASYFLQKIENLKNVEGARYKAHIDNFEVKNTKDMAKFLSEHHYCDEGTTIAAVQHIALYLAEQLRRGNKVSIDGIGTFEPSLAYENITEVSAANGNETTLRVDGLHIQKINVHIDKQLLRQANKGFSATRSRNTPTVIPNERMFTRDQRIELLRQHFTNSKTITIKEYTQLTCIPHTAAAKELHEFCKGDSPLLHIEGSGTHIRFILR